MALAHTSFVLQCRKFPTNEVTPLLTEVGTALNVTFTGVIVTDVSWFVW